MDPWQEPVRGEALPPVAFALDGLERLRGWGRLWRPSPMFHLLGLRVTQVVSGSAVASMPVSPWLAHPDGVIEIGLLADTVCGLAADTVLKPGKVVVGAHADYRPIRMVRADTRSLVGRASVVRTGPDWAYVEGQLEDGDGRAVAHVGAHLGVRDAWFAVPDRVPALEAVDVPSYPTPDPHRRPVPREKHEVVERFHEDGCVDTFTAIAAGDAPLPPLHALLGIRPARAEPGHVVTEMTASGWLKGAEPTNVSPSYVRTHAIDCGVAAMWTLAPRGLRPAIFGFSSLFAGTVPAEAQTITARATAERLDDQMLHARVETLDGDRRVAVSSVSGRLVQTGQVIGQRSRTLATVLFTDVVDSTAAAERMGDGRWRRVLERHQADVRRRLDEHGGREVKSTGDGFLATFDTPTSAVECACDIRDDVQALGIGIRAGVHTGEVEVMGGDVAGITVHVAARIESAADAGEVWVSDTVRALAAASTIEFKDRGLHELKGVDGEVRLHSVER